MCITSSSLSLHWGAVLFCSVNLTFVASIVMHTDSLSMDPWLAVLCYNVDREPTLVLCAL